MEEEMNLKLDEAISIGKIKICTVIYMLHQDKEWWQSTTGNSMRTRNGLDLFTYSLSLQFLKQPGLKALKLLSYFDLVLLS